MFETDRMRSEVFAEHINGDLVRPALMTVIEPSQGLRRNAGGGADLVPLPSTRLKLAADGFDLIHADNIDQKVLTSKTHPSRGSGYESRMNRPTAAPEIFRANLRAIVKENGGNPTAAAKRLGVAQRTLDRMLKGERSTGIDMLERLARKLGLQPWQLLVEHLDPADPPMLERDIGDLRRVVERIKNL